MRLVLSLAVLLLTSSVFAETPAPKGATPLFGLASAVEKEGKVIVTLSELRDVIGIKMPDGVGDVFIEHRHWLELASGPLNEEIRAYRPDGKRATAQEVLKALAKPSGVAYFVGYDKAKPIQPDPFFLGLLKEGTVALAIDRTPLDLPVQP